MNYRFRPNYPVLEELRRVGSTLCNLTRDATRFAYGTKVTPRGGRFKGRVGMIARVEEPTRGHFLVRVQFYRKRGEGFIKGWHWFEVDDLQEV